METTDEVAARLSAHAEGVARSRGTGFTPAAKTRMDEIARLMAEDIAAQPDDAARRSRHTQAEQGLGTVVARMVAVRPREARANFAKPPLDEAQLSAAILPWPLERDERVDKEIRGVEGLRMAASVAAQIVTLASGLLTFTVVFAGNFRPSPTTRLAAPAELVDAWWALGVTILAGLVTILVIVSALDAHDRLKSQTVGANTWQVALPGAAMILSFLAALLCIALAMQSVLTAPG